MKKMRWQLIKRRAFTPGPVPTPANNLGVHWRHLDLNGSWRQWPVMLLRRLD